MTIAIEIALCLALIYALGSMVCSVINEWIAQIFRLRWNNLQQALVDIVGSDSLTTVMNHPLLKNVWDAKRHPTAIPTAVFARALVHAFVPEGGQGTTTAVAPGQSPTAVTSSTPTVCTDAKQLIASLPPELQRQIVPFLDGTEQTVESLYKATESWFDQSMSSASDWYARQSHWLSIAVAVLFAIACNIDSIAIGSALAHEPQQRAALVEVAEKTVAQYQTNPSSVCPDQASEPDRQRALQKCLASLQVAGADFVGWNAGAWQRVHEFSALALAFLGWLVSGLAMSLGSRFWFGVLSRVVSVRAGLDPNAVKDGAPKTVPVS